jgi:hypothetical protein
VVLVVAEVVLAVVVQLVVVLVAKLMQVSVLQGLGWMDIVQPV